MRTITVDGIEYAPISEVPPPAPQRIVILQRGWVMVGNWNQDGEDVVLTNARVIRVWGTTKGLGELALSGPTSKTVLDDAGTARFHVLTVIAALDCVSGW